MGGFNYPLVTRKPENFLKLQKFSSVYPFTNNESPASYVSGWGQTFDSLKSSKRRKYPWDLNDFSIVHALLDHIN